MSTTRLSDLDFAGEIFEFEDLLAQNRLDHLTYPNLTAMEEDNSLEVNDSAVVNNGIFDIHEVIDVDNEEDMTDPNTIYYYNGTHYYGDGGEAIGFETVNGFAVLSDKNTFVTPEMFGDVGTDADILEYAINNIPKGGTLFINRTYILDRDIVITKKSPTKRIALIGSNNACIDVASFHIKGSIVGNTGNIEFTNINFKSTDKIFDGYYLIRLYFTRCSFYSMKSIIYNSNSESNDSYCQSIYFDGCEIRHLTEPIIDSGTPSNRSQLMDVEFVNCLIEWCHSSIMNARGYSSVRIENNCIEGFTTSEPLIANCREGSGLIIKDNYFESNHVTYVDFSNMNVQNPFTFIFEGNSIFEHVNQSFGIIKTGSKNDGTGSSIYNVSNNTFASLAQYGSQIYMIDASNATEDLVNWCVWNNHIYNNYMAKKHDPNNRLQIYKNVNTELTTNLENRYGLTNLEAGATITFRAYMTGMGINSHIMSLPVMFPFIIPSSKTYSINVRNMQVTDIPSSSLDVSKISLITPQFNAGCELRYNDQDTSLFTANRPYNVRLTIELTIANA